MKLPIDRPTVGEAEDGRKASDGVWWRPMVRIIPGQSWKLNPSYLSALKSTGGGAAVRRFSPQSIFDVLGIEIDGVDLCQGLPEAALFQTVDELCTAVLKLCREPVGGAQVSLVEGRAELVLGRRCGRATLCLVSLARPARVLAGEVEVDLPALAFAVGSCCLSLVSDLSKIHPALANAPATRKLARQGEALHRMARLAFSSLVAAQPLADAKLVRPAAPGSPSLSFTLHDAEDRIGTYRRGPDLYSLLCPGQVELRAEDGARLACWNIPPFLLLTDAVRAAGDVFRAVEERASSCELAMGVGAPLLLLNLRSEGFSIDGRCVPCRPLWLARGLLEAALDFSGVISARNPAQAGNPYLGSLAEAARSRLALLAEIEGGDLYAERDGELLPSPRSPSGPPISRGTLKRLRFEAAWDGADTGVRARAMALTRRTLIVLGEKNVAFLKPGTGSLIASRRAEGAFLAEGGVLLATGTQCEGLTTDGRPAFLRRPAGWDAPFLTDTAGSCRAGTRGQPATLCIYDGHRVAAVYAATGSTAWQFTAPEAVRVRAASLVRRVFVAADNGFLYALDSVDGRVVFRVRLANALEGLDVDSRSVAVLGRRDGELWLAVVESASGRPRMSRPLAMQAVGRVALLRNRVVVSGILESGSGIVGFSLGGRKTFAHTLASPARGIPAIGLHHRRLLCALRDGSLSCFSDAGRRLWDVSSCGPELEEAVRPCLRRGVLVAGSDPIRAIDPATGALLCELPVLHGLSALAVSPRLDVFAADEDGVVACFRLTTHLSVV